jgi:hypothetical protein
MTYYTLLSLGKALGEKNIVHPIPALWLPNLVIGGIGAHFFRQALRETPPVFPKLLDQAALWVGGFVGKLRPTKPY